MSYKQYSEMTEALAERLLDLHCRLLTLYIIQDADCLHWENTQPFFESERGSYTIQMWWLYMQGTKQDLWNSVPPNMAQRVFSGMLNETLTILAVRYTQTVPSKARSPLLLVDICNLLLCVAELLPLISDNGEAYVGLGLQNQSKIIRDIHAKCQELFCCLLLRGVPLGVLYKILRKENSTMGLFGSRQGLPSPWIIFALPKLFPPNQNGHWATRCSDFGINTAIALEIKVLLGAPQSNWSLLLKVLLMREATLSSIIIHHLIKNLPSSDCYVPSLKQPLMDRDNFPVKCDGFLCGNECKEIKSWTNGLTDPIGQTNYQVVLALCYIIMVTGKSSDMNQVIITALEKNSIKNWASCLDRRQVWNQKRPPWLEAMIHLVYPVLEPIVHMLISAVQSGGSMYQAMALSISCFSEMWDCIPDCLYTITQSLAEILPAEIKPLGDACLIQILFCSLYTKLLQTSDNELKKCQGKNEEELQLDVNYVKGTICQTLAEAICFIDEDNKHTDQLKQFLNQTRESQRVTNILDTDVEDVIGLSFVSTVKIDDIDGNIQNSPSTRSAEEYDVETAEYIAEVLASDILTTQVGKQCVKIMYKYLRSNEEWILQQLNVSEVERNEFETLPGQKNYEENSTLLKIMFHIGHQTFDQLLTGSLKIDYNAWLQTPMSMTEERAWFQVAKRYEFQENSKIMIHDAVMVASIMANLKPS